MLNVVSGSRSGRGPTGRVVAHVARTVAALAAFAALVALAARGGRRAAATMPRVTVEGASMEPLLAPGDRLLLVPPFRLRPGHIVALPDPRHPSRLLVKRVRSIDRPMRLLWVEGDNSAHSTDSRAFGRVPLRAVRGRAVYRYAPQGRVGPIGGGP